MARTSSEFFRHPDLYCRRRWRADTFAPLLNLCPDLVANEADLFEFCGFAALHLRRIWEAPMQSFRWARENGTLLRAGFVAHRNNVGEELAGFEHVEDSLRSLLRNIDPSFCHYLHRQRIERARFKTGALGFEIFAANPV